MKSFVAIAALAALATVRAQDPAPGWVVYATASCPAGTVITSFAANWTVGAAPKASSSFYSPWVGIEASDNLNLLQPVNPWLGNVWQIYNEYYQWQPTNNQNSQATNVNPGDALYGSVTLNSAQNSYTVYHLDEKSGWSVAMPIGIQKKAGVYKNYTIAYVVYEKVAPCGDYPPDGKVDFSNIIMQCNGQTIAPTWTTGAVDEVCDFAVQVVSPTEITMTWNPAAKDPAPELIRASQSNPYFGRRQA